jgi:hypothetical protein
LPEKGPRAIGANPLSITDAKTERLSGLAAALPARVKIYRV